MKVKKIDLVLFLCFFALFKVFAIPTIIQQITKIAILIVIIIFVVHRQKLKELFNVILLFCFFIIFSSVYNAYSTGTIGISNALNGILHGCCIYICFMLITYCAKNNMMDHVIDSLLFILVLYVIFSFITIFYNGTSSVKAIYYFAGNKFRTSYYFMLLWSVIYAKCGILPVLQVFFCVINFYMFLVKMFDCGCRIYRNVFDDVLSGKNAEIFNELEVYNREYSRGWNNNYYFKADT